MPSDGNTGRLQSVKDLFHISRWPPLDHSCRKRNAGVSAAASAPSQSHTLTTDFIARRLWASAMSDSISSLSTVYAIVFLSTREHGYFPRAREYRTAAL